MSELLLGVDIGSYSVKLVQLSKDGDEYTLSGFATSKLKPGAVSGGQVVDFDDVHNKIQTALSQMESYSNKASTLLHGRKTSVHKIKYAGTDAVAIAKNFAGEIEQYVPGDASGLYYDYIVQPHVEGTRHTNVYVAYTPKDQVKEMRDVIGKSSLDLINIELEALAITNHFVKTTAHVKKPVLVISVGHEISTFLFIRDQKIDKVMTRNIGGLMATKTLQIKFEVDYDKAEEMKFSDTGLGSDQFDIRDEAILDFCTAFCDEITSVIDEYKQSGGEKPLRMHILGGGTNLEDFAGHLAKITKNRIEILNFFDLYNIQYEEGFDCQSYNMALLTALIGPQDCKVGNDDDDDMPGGGSSGDDDNGEEDA